MTIAFAFVFTTLHLEDNHLVTLYEWLNNFTYYFCALYSWSAYCDSTLVINEKYLLKLNGLTFLCFLDVVHEEFLAFFSLELLAVDFYNRVHLL